MPIDATIISGLKPPQSRPLETVAKVQGIQAGILGNRQLSQEIQGKEAVGRAVTAATDSKTGETDWDKAAANLNLDPQGAWKANEFGAAILDRKAKEIANATAKAGLTQAQLKTSQATFTAVGDWAAAVAAAGSKAPATLNPQAIIGSAKTALLDSGIINPQDENQRNQLLSVMAQFGPDPAKNMAILKQVFLQGHATAEGVALALGTPTTMDTGPAIETRRVAPLTGEVSTLATTPKGLGPAESAALVPVKDANGQTVLVPRGSMADQQPGAPQVAGGATTTAPGAVAVQSLAPGVAEARSTSGTTSATAYQEDLAQAGGYAQRLQGLEKGAEALEKALTGPGASKLQQWSAVLNTFNIKTPPGVDVDSYAKAQKYLQDYANQRGSALGFGTDAARGLVNAANPGVQTPKGAAVQVINVIKGLERMQAAQVAAAQAEKVPPDQYADWRAKWNRSVDPAAFAPPKLTREGWEQKRKSMGSKWDAYKRGLDAALAAGVLTAADLRK